MQPGSAGVAFTTAVIRLLLIGAFLMMHGCGSRLTPPAALQAPYQQSQLWGAVPFANESGVSVVDSAAVADAFVEEAQQVRGIDTIPVNRVIAAMRELGRDAIVSDGDALALMNVLDLDGLAVGTVTAYDPYRPMRLGLAVQLYVRDASSRSGVDPRRLGQSISGAAAPGELGPPRPKAQAAGVFDATNHQTLKRLREYAAGRSEPESAYGEDIYLVSMELYTNFVCHQLLRELLTKEWSRVVLAAEETEVTR